MGQNVGRFRYFLGFIVVIGGGIFSANGMANKKYLETISDKETSLFYHSVLERIRQEYVDTVTNDQLLEGSFQGLLSSLDPHSTYLTQTEYNDLRSKAEGHYGGLGIEMTMKEGAVLVISPLEDGPAEKSGIEPGDMIVMIDGEPVDGLSAHEASKRLKGEPKTSVTLTILRAKTQVLEKTIERAVIKTKTLKWHIQGDMAYIRLTQFNFDTTRELIKAVQEIKMKLGTTFRGVVLDLRNNAGGLFDQAVFVSDAFLNNGTIVSVKGRNSADFVEKKATKGDVLNGLPMVVLVNSGSASSSEIVAAALQENKRALIVGTRTFGKGSVQKIFPLPGQGAIKLTTALYYTPKGRSIQKHGVDPDIILPQAMGLASLDDPQALREASLTKAINTARDLKKDGDTDKKLDAKKTNAPEKTAPKPDGKVPSFMDKKIDDYQLEGAFQILKTLSLCRTGCVPR